MLKLAVEARLTLRSQLNLRVAPTGFPLRRAQSVSLNAAAFTWAHCF